MIRISDLNVYFGKSQILKDVNLCIDCDDSIIGLFGPNGAGKTTLINAITGSINNFTGKIEGIDPQNISFLPDKPFIYKSMKLKDAIGYYKAAFQDFDSEKAEKLFNMFIVK